MNKVLSLHAGIVDIDIPTPEETKRISISKWEEEIGSVEPINLPEKGDSFLIFGPQKRKMPDSSHCIKVIEGMGGIMPNVHGLTIIEEMDRKINFLPEGSFLVGFDYKENLTFFKKHGGHILPCLHKVQNGEYLYMWFPWGMNLEENEYLVFFKKNNI